MEIVGVIVALRGVVGFVNETFKVVGNCLLTAACLEDINDVPSPDRVIPFVALEPCPVWPLFGNDVAFAEVSIQKRMLMW